MKIIVRAFVIALVLTGAVASTHSVPASAQTIAVSVMPSVAAVPVCDPTDPGDCGMGTNQKKK
jgi:hypothetical protein